MDAHQQKRLNSELVRIDEMVAQVRLQVTEGNNQLAILKKQRAEVIQKLEALKINNNGLPVVSEHALLRYLERVNGVNLEEIKRQILTDAFQNIYRQFGTNGTYPFADGMTLKVVNGTVVTIIPSGQPTSEQTKKRKRKRRKKATIQKDEEE